MECGGRRVCPQKAGRQKVEERTPDQIKYLWLIDINSQMLSLGVREGTAL
jgi:hypothetical protein